LRPFFSKDGSEASTTPLASEATPTAPPTPPVELHLEDPFKHNVNGLLPSAASVVRALSPLLSPAFQAANNMSQKVLKAKEAVHGGLHESDQVVVEEEPAVHKISPKDLPMMTQADFEEQYDIVQKIGEGWFSRVYLTEHRRTHQEMVLKAINSKNMSVEEFLREFHHSLLLGSHRNILTVFPDMVFTIGNIRPPAFGLYI